MAFDPWSYDANKDCFLDINEAMAAVHDWEWNGLITESQAMQVVNLWQTGAKNPACGVTEVAGWKLLKSIDITLKPPAEIGGWQLLQSIDITLKPPGEVGGWKLLQSIDITLTPTGVEPPPVTCSIDADCPEGYECKSGKCVKKGGFPWQWLAIAGAAIAGVILLIPKPKKAKEVK